MDWFNWEICQICHRSYQEGQNGLCARCHELWPRIDHPCRICSLPLKQHDQICGHCLKRLPAFDSIVCSGRYEGILAWLIKQLKYHGKALHIRPMAAALIDELSCRAIEMPELLLPMPLHWSRQWRRGFNQSHLIAQEISHQLHIPIATNVVKRHKRTPALEGLDRKARQRLLRNSFSARGTEARSVAIIDDVVTTGASVQALSLALRSSGFEKIQVWALARTPE